jgi:hypothetical protein
MIPDTTPQLAYAKKKDNSKLVGIFSLVLVVLGVIGMLYIQSPLKKSQDLRQDASVSTGTVQILTNPADASQFTVGQQRTVDLLINTQNMQTDGVQLTFNIVGATTDVPLVEVVDSSGLHRLAGEVEGTAGNYLVTLVATPLIGQPFAVNNPVTFAKVTFTPAATGTITFNFDAETSISTVYGSNPVQDELKTISSSTYTVLAADNEPDTSPSPSPAASPETSPSASPEASPAVSPSPSPSPSPSADPGIGGGTIKQCNESCASNADCGVNHRCYNGACRLVTNPSSSTCVNPPDGGLQRTCNQYCADIRECASGYSCLENKCRRADNPDSTTCSAPSAATQQQIVGSCGKTCNANADCAVNLRCYKGACRLATNPSSTSCSATTAKTVSPIYDKSTDKGGDTSDQDDDDSTSTAGGAIRVSPRPSVSPSASPVASTAPKSEKTALDTLRGLVPARVLALIAIGVGLLLLVFLILSRLGRKPRPVTPPMTPRPAAPAPTPYEQELQSRVDALKKESAGPPPSAMTPPPVMQRPVVVTPPAPPMTPPPVAQPVPPQTPVFNQAPSTQSTMLERIKEKGINPPNSNQT